MILKISAKCDDRCCVTSETGQQHNGYVPSWIGIGGGDYLRLEIDTATGKILNWVPPSEESLKELFPSAQPDPRADIVEDEPAFGLKSRHYRFYKSSLPPR